VQADLEVSNLLELEASYQISS